MDESGTEWSQNGPGAKLRGDGGGDRGAGDGLCEGAASVRHHDVLEGGEEEGLTDAPCPTGARRDHGMETKEGDFSLQPMHEASDWLDAGRSQISGEAGEPRRSSKVPDPLPRRRARRCKFWNTAGGCRAGSACKFLHDSQPPVMARGKEMHVAEGTGPAARHRRTQSPMFGGGDGNGNGDSSTGMGMVSVHEDEDEEGEGEGEEEQGRDGGGDDAMDVSVDAAVAELVYGMQRLFVPSKLSFGRSARRGRPFRGGRR